MKLAFGGFTPSLAQRVNHKRSFTDRSFLLGRVRTAGPTGCCYKHEELVEHFPLTPADLQLVLTCRGEANRCGIALLLKALTYLGYVPDSLDCVPHEVRSFIAGQLGLLWDFSEQYRWDSRTRELHLFGIRRHTGWRFPTAQDKDDLERWLREEAALEVQEGERLFDHVGVVSGFETMKHDPGKPGVENLQAEIDRLRAIRAIGLVTGSGSRISNVSKARCRPFPLLPRP
ncbi:MAG: DUF4158 domain-containing protein [Isosphaeraceae bacterium]